MGDRLHVRLHHLSATPDERPPEADRPRWDRLLDPLRSEQAAFALLLRVVAVAALVIAVALVVRAL